MCTMKNDFHSETYIVTVDYEGGKFEFRILRDDRKHHWEEVGDTEIAKTKNFLDIGPIIGTDFGERREEENKDHEGGSDQP